MKNKKLALILALVISLLIFMPFANSKIDVSKYPAPDFFQSNLPINNDIRLSLSIIETGFTTAPEAFVFKGGNLFKIRKLSHMSVLVQHPKGNFVFDTGLGEDIENQFHDNNSFFNRQIFKFTKSKSLYKALVDNNFNPDAIDFIIPSHLHFDHASGIEDFLNATIRTTKEEYDYALSAAAKPPAFIQQQYDAKFIKWKFIDFDSVPYEVFAESYDVFNDGTVILVKLPGHTKGSIGMFVNLASGKRYFFTGDLTWAAEAFMGPSEKNIILRNKVDGDRELVASYIVKVHHLIKEKPEIHIVPAHDYNAQKDIAHFPEVEF